MRIHLKRSVFQPSNFFGFTLETEIDILKELQKRIGTNIAIRIQHVNQIERSSRGKLRSIISKIEESV